MEQNCPCGHSKKYMDCCGAMHHGLRETSSAQELMRSRYTAFTLGLGDYLMHSWYSEKRPMEQKVAIEKWAKSVTWKGLNILEYTKGGSEDAEGSVQFEAHFEEGGELDCIQENSGFVREKGRWVYFEGQDSD